MSLINYYLLDAEGKPFRVDSFLKWAAGIEADRRVAFDAVGEAEVSTVFLGVGSLEIGTGRLFETLVRGGVLDEVQRAYATRDEAMRGHAECLREATIAAHVEAVVRFSITAPFWCFYEGRLSPVFRAWCADALRFEPHLFLGSFALGFLLASDAAIFKLSHWSRQCSD